MSQLQILSREPDITTPEFEDRLKVGLLEIASSCLQNDIIEFRSIEVPQEEEEKDPNNFESRATQLISQCQTLLYSIQNEITLEKAKNEVLLQKLRHG